MSGTPLESHSRSITSRQHVDSAASPLGDGLEPTGSHRLIEPQHFARVSLSSEKSDDNDRSASSSDAGSEHDALVVKALEPLVRQASPFDAIGDHDEPAPPPPITSPEKEKAVSWSQLPRKRQLAILTLARLSEPLAATSLQSYVFYQLKSFKLPDGGTPTDETVATQAGVLAAAFSAAQFVTAIFWGRMADWERMGRKRVILVGLLGVSVGSLGFGFSQSFPEAVFWRCVAGLLNGNVGVMRTMISEIITEKRFQSRAFLLLPMTFNVGVVIGPLIGGLLADPAGNYPNLFGPASSFGGQNGVYWLQKWPYALPNVVTATFLFMSAVALVLGLEETHEALRGRPDYGLRFSRWIGRTVLRMKPKQEYVPVEEQDAVHEDVESYALVKDHQRKARLRPKLPLRRIWTRNVVTTLFSYAILAMHIGTFNSLWFVYLSTSRYDPDYHPPPQIRAADSSAEHTTPLEVPENYHPHLPFQFTGGLALPPSSIGTALSILGVLGLTLQLLLYPRLSFRLGTIRSLRYSLLLFPMAYALIPFLSTIPSTRPPPGQASGFLVWMGITMVLFIQVAGRTFALPSNAILLNNCSPHPSVLGTLHGIGQSVSAGARTVGPALAGWIYSVGLRRGVVGLAWWFMAGVAILGAVVSHFVWEGDGHEIWLEGDKEEVEDDK